MEFQETKWYRFLNRAGSKCLLSCEDCSNRLIVCKINSHGFRNYAVFANIEAFYFYLSAHPQVQEYHEVIQGKAMQKPRFDIDLTNKNCNSDDLVATGERIRNALLRGIWNLLAPHYDFDLARDVGLYTSQADTERFSCHVIVHSFYVANCQEAEQFCRKTIEASQSSELQKAFEKKIIDLSVYRNTCCLRMLGSFKKGQRPKNAQFVYSFEGQVIDWSIYLNSAIDLFQKSAITSICDSARLISN